MVTRYLKAQKYFNLLAADRHVKFNANIKSSVAMQLCNTG